MKKVGVAQLKKKADAYGILTSWTRSKGTENTMSEIKSVYLLVIEKSIRKTPNPTSLEQGNTTTRIVRKLASIIRRYGNRGLHGASVTQKRLGRKIKRDGARGASKLLRHSEARYA